MKHTDPEASEHYCCEKCGMRHHGLPAGMSGKRHYKYCQKIEAPREMMGPPPELMAMMGGGMMRPCANPECYYMAHSDPTVSAMYCCEKCELRHQGLPGGEGGKS